MDQTLLDRLVDGELNSDERAGLLRQLEAEPTNWRRLALTFLEAQSWRDDLRAHAAPRDFPVAPVPPVKPRRPWRAAGALLAACLAGAAVTFGIMSLSSPVPSVARQRPETGPLPGEFPQGGNRAVAQSPRPQDTSVKTMKVILTNAGTGESQAQDMPIVEASQLSPDWLRNLPAMAASDVRRAFEKEGHRVREEQRLVPLQLPDGRTGYVPVSDVYVETQPVNYQ